MKKDAIAILFGGGHVANFQAATESALEVATKAGHTLLAFDAGFTGFNNGTVHVVTHNLVFSDRAGIYFGSSRDKVDVPEAIDTIIRIEERGYRLRGVGGMVGDNHIEELRRIQAAIGMPVSSWPKTMDNDLSETVMTLGFHTAVQNTKEVVQRAYDNAFTNRKAHFIGVFGRDTDHVAAATAGFGDSCLVIGGERKYTLSQVIEMVARKYDENGVRYGAPFAVIVVSEGAKIEGIEKYIPGLVEYDKDGKPVFDKDGRVKLIREYDKHRELKLNPELIAMALSSAMKDEYIPSSYEAIKYAHMRDAPPTKLDFDLGKEAGAEMMRIILDGDIGQGVVLKQDEEREYGLKPGRAPMEKIKNKRRAMPEGILDYDTMTTTPALVERYQRYFGQPYSTKERLPRLNPIRLK